MPQDGKSGAYRMAEIAPAILISAIHGGHSKEREH